MEISDTEEGASPSTFATLLRRYRRRARMTQEGLAERAHLSRGAVSSLERGERLAPRKETVALLATALELADADRSALYEAARHRHTRPHPTGGLTPLVFPVVQPASISPWFSTSGLPTPPTPLIGREDEMARAGALIGEGKARLLTLTGPGGVGKTRLALAIASACREFFTDDVVFVPLASLSQPALLAATLARAVGANSEGGDQPGQATIACLRDKHMLLVLDNFERLLPAAQFIADLLASCPHLVILVTSRAILQIQGEQTLPVAPLVLPSTSAFPAKAGCLVTQAELEALAASPAIALFAQRAQAVRPEFTLTRGECGRRGQDLPAAGWLAPGAGTGGGAHQADAATCLAHPTAAAASHADGWRSRPARAASDVAGRLDMEL